MDEKAKRFKQEISIGPEGLEKLLNFRMRDRAFSREFFENPKKALKDEGYEISGENEVNVAEFFRTFCSQRKDVQGAFLLKGGKIDPTTTYLND